MTCDPRKLLNTRQCTHNNSAERPPLPSKQWFLIVVIVYHINNVILSNRHFGLHDTSRRASANINRRNRVH
jgi:hypothetical protein